MGQARLVFNRTGRGGGRVLTVGGVVQQLQDETVADEVARRHRERRREPHELGRALVGRVDLALEREPEQLAVEALRPFEIGDALARHLRAVRLNTTPSLTVPILARASLGRHAFAAEVAVVAREAAAGREVEPPVVQAAREHAVVDLAEAGQVGLAVRAPTLDAPPVALEELVGAFVRRSVALLDVGDALGRQAP